MAATVLVRHALSRISTLLTDTAPQFRRWTEGELIQWLNDGQSAIVTYVPTACSRLDSIKLRPGTQQSIDSIAAADCRPGDGSTPVVAIRGRQFLAPICNMGADGLRPGRSIREVERDTLDAIDPNWHTSTGSTVYDCAYHPSTPKYFHVAPGVPDIGAVWMRIAYTADPLPIPAGGAPGAEVYAASGASTQTITIDDEHLEALVDYVCARAHLKDSKYAEPLRHKLHASAFLLKLNAKVTALTGTNPNLTVMPGVSAPGRPA